jgi:hypothetical protein
MVGAVVPTDQFDAAAPEIVDAAAGGSPISRVHRQR